MTSPVSTNDDNGLSKMALEIREELQEQLKMPRNWKNKYSNFRLLVCQFPIAGGEETGKINRTFHFQEGIIGISGGFNSIRQCG